jgi:hypothetical protein
VEQRKQAKLQWLQDPSKINVDNLDNVRHATSRRFRKKKKGEYLKGKFNELKTDSNNRIIRSLYRGINEFKKG